MFLLPTNALLYFCISRSTVLENLTEPELLKYSSISGEQGRCQFTNWLVRSLCQICRSLSRQERCRRYTTRWSICFAPPRTLPHAMQPPPTHEQKPSRTMYRIIW